MKFKKLVFLIIVSSLLCACADSRSGNIANAQSIRQSDFIQLKVSESLYVLKHPNYHTNIGVFTGSECVVLIDPMSGSNRHLQLLNVIKQLSNKPIKYVINTHHHIDHSGANKFFRDQGATIISHKNAKYSKAVYGITFEDIYSLDLGDETVTLYHEVAHTFDDVLVHFTNNNAVFMGDTYMTNSFPHFYYGGGKKGHSAIIDKALSLGNDQTMILPAHGNLTSSKAKLITYHENSHKWTNRIKALSMQGMSSFEIAEDEQIKKLSTFFNDGRNVSKASIQRTLDKTISVDLMAEINLPDNELKSYEGFYIHENGQTDEIVIEDERLLLRSDGNYIYELLPSSSNKFHIKGQFPHQHLTFNKSNQQFTFFNGKQNRTAKQRN